MRERKYVLTPCYWNLISQTSPITAKIHGITSPVVWGIYSHGFMKQVYLQSDWEKVCEFISDRLSDPNYLTSLQKLLAVAEEKALSLVSANKWSDLKKLSVSDLLSRATLVQKCWLEYDQINVPAWLWGADLFREKVRRSLGISEEDIALLTQPDQKTYVTSMELEVAQAKEAFLQDPKSISASAEKLSEKYGWIIFGYNGPQYGDKDYFIQRIKDADLPDSISPPKFKVNNPQLQQLKFLATWTDERKRVEFQLHYLYHRILKELEARSGIDHLEFLFTEELKDLETKSFQQLIHDRRNKTLVVKARGGKYQILSEAQARELLRELEEEVSKEIKGRVASPGTKKIYRGRARVLLSPSESGRIQEGEFLVTTMTCPPFIIAMGKAQGFITDEGGITCHAAIVAREMDKPCIIGTGNATKVLKDGDFIEVDTTKGTVKTIKQ